MNAASAAGAGAGPGLEPELAFDGDLDLLVAMAAPLLQRLRDRGWRLATAESCTGGLIAAALTSVAGSSDVFDRGFVTYSNEAKADLLGVPAQRIACDGAVSESVARAMAEGALQRSLAHLAVSVTGVAGPGGGTAAKPVGLVWLGLAQRSSVLPGGTVDVQAWRLQFQGTRAAIRGATVREALRRVGDAAA